MAPFVAIAHIDNTVKYKIKYAKKNCNNPIKKPDWPTINPKQYNDANAIKYCNQIIL